MIGRIPFPTRFAGRTLAETVVFAAATNVYQMLFPQDVPDDPGA